MEGDTGTGGESSPTGRRQFLSTLATWLMRVGLVAGFGTITAFAARFFAPRPRLDRRWQYVRQVSRIGEGDVFRYQAPDGATIAVARRAAGDGIESFVALSSTCPHLGCRVHWEPWADRFFCPCHNGVFAPDGSPVSGPPEEANTPLAEYPLQIANGLLFVEVPLDRVV